MRLSNVLVFGAVWLAFLIIGCQDAPPVGPTSEFGNSSYAVSATGTNLSTHNSGSPAKGRVVKSVTGSGHFRINGKLRNFAFNAREYADGTVDGQWQVHNRKMDAKGHGEVTCLTFIGNQAWLGGFATSGVASAPPNNEVAWRVVDNGEGKNALPDDQISLQFFTGPAGFASSYCDATPAAPDLNDIEAGNIKIHQ